MVFAHAGHGDEFQGEKATSDAGEPIQVDPEMAKQLGIVVEPVTNRQIDVGLKTTGQIETLPSKRVEVTAPTPGKIVELLVEPGASVRAGQPVAVLAAPELVELRVSSQEKKTEAQADFRKAQADLQLAQQNLERQRQIAAADIERAKTQVNVAQERYDRDKELEESGALPRRDMLESQTQLAQAKAELAQANSQQNVLEAVNLLQRAQSDREVAKSRLNLSNATYQTRLQQLGTLANEQGMVVVTAPIAGRIANRPVTLGQSFQDAGGQLMTIVDNRKVLVTANIYEKDLDQVKQGQRVKAKVASLPKRTFTGRITIIGSLVEGETRTTPVKAELENPNGVLKPGMFAELEVLTSPTAILIVAIPSAAVVEANSKKLVYVQNGNAFLPVEVTLGQIFGDWVEVKSGLFAGDAIVTQRAPQLYAQSLRGGSKKEESEDKKETTSQANKTLSSSLPVPEWLAGAGGGVLLSTVAFSAGLLAYRRQQIKTDSNSRNPTPSSFPESTTRAEE
ncbi:efflux RND transporter periplasmic adaptor subunit [Aphanothece hegewaldii]|nr:efflux RND transporter periplasmic adaptor subunit [Aphanothece hegewaldii]